MTRSASLTRRITGGAVAVGLGLAGALGTAGVAVAGVPNHWGFAYVSAPAKAGTPPLTHQAGSWPAPFHVHVTPGAVGQVLVVFPRVAAKGGVVHVTAVGDGPFWCQVQSFGPAGPNENAKVRCLKTPGIPAWVPFTIMFTQSARPAGSLAGRYGYVHYQPGHGIVSGFNSIGAANKVKVLGPGRWLVTLPELGASPAAGGIQVTAVNASQPAKCEIAAWKSEAPRQLINIRCYNHAAAPLSTGWTLSYQNRRAITGTKPAKFAYTFNNKPTVSSYVPLPAGVNFNSALMVNHIQHAGTGLSLIRFPGVGLLPDDVLVSGFAVGPGFCNLNTTWGTFGSNVIVRDVGCYTYTGVLINRQSMISYTGR
jgi:hypothetical protein